MTSKTRKAYRDKEDRPWYKLKYEKTLDAEEKGSVRKDLYYLTDDQLKMFALLTAVEDRKKHNLTDMPALNNMEFRNSFMAGGGVSLALENNTDLISAAEIARDNFSHIIGSGCPLERTLAGATVTIDVDTDVGDTHVRGDAEVTIVSTGDRGPAGMSLDVDPATPDHSDFSRDEGSSSLPSSSGRADAGSRANASDARPCSYTDVRLDQRSSHGDAAAGPPDLVGWVAGPGGQASTSAASSSAASSSGPPPANPGGPPYEWEGSLWRTIYRLCLREITFGLSRPGGQSVTSYLEDHFDPIR